MKLNTNINTHAKSVKQQNYNPVFLMRTQKYVLGKKVVNNNKKKVISRTQKKSNVAANLLVKKTVATRKVNNKSKFKMFIPMSGSRKCGGCGYH